MAETLDERIRRAVQEVVDIVPYNPEWPNLFLEEKGHLLTCLPRELIGRIEHFGSTAISHIAAKPIIDMLVEVKSLEEAMRKIVPILESQGYDYFWRLTWGNDTPPFYAWFHQAKLQRQKDSSHPHGGASFRALGSSPISGLSNPAS